MKKNLIKIITCLLVVLLLVLGTYSFAFAETPGDSFYLGLSVVSDSIGTKDNSYAGDGETIYVPTLDSGTGFAITGGMNFSGEAFEIGYTNSSHNGSYQNTSFSATENIFDLNYKRFFTDSDQPLKPYWLGGLCITGLVVKDGAVSPSKSGNATYTGFGLNIGSGVDYRLKSNLSLKGELLYRWISYFSAEGMNTSGSLDDSFDGSGLCLNIGLNYYFN
jgi:hypothetical protein